MEIDIENPLISIIVPFYNRVELLFETLESIRQQKFKDFEVLLIDDGSEKTNILLIEEKLLQYNDKRFKLIAKPSSYNKGANSSRVYGLEISRGDYVKWFDSDDLMVPDSLEIQCKVIEEMGLDGVFAVGALYNNDFSKLLRSSWREKHYSENALVDYLKTALAWPSPSGLWKKQSIAGMHPFSQKVKNGQEWIFHLWILTSNLNVGVIDKELFKIRSHPDSVSRFKTDDYFLNRIKTRTIALSRLIQTRNGGKRYILKSLLTMYKKLSIGRLPYAILLTVQNLRLNYSGKRQKANLILIKD